MDGAPVIAVTNAVVPPEMVLNLPIDGDTTGLTQLPGGRIAAIRHDASAVFESAVLILASPTSAITLDEALTAEGSGVLRAKGMPTDATTGRRVVLQVVGKRWSTHTARQTDASVNGRIVVIGLRGQLAALTTGLRRDP